MNKLLILALLAICTCTEDKFFFMKFQQYVTKFNKNYRTIQEFMMRFKIFKDNVQNLKSYKTWKTGVTRFSDMTPQEFRKTYLNLDFTALATLNLHPAVVEKVNPAPESFNWMDQKVLGEVKDQSACGSCWAFSAIANIEGQAFLQKKMTVRLSEQQMVDCDTYDSGCNGGLQERTFEWIKEHQGLMLEKDYPYRARKQSCKSDQSKFVEGLELTGYKKLGNCAETWCDVDEVEIRDFLLKTGPLAIALNADLLQLYSEGIIDADEWECDPDGMNHAVTLVGYGHDADEDLDFWIVRNSWGDYWGEDGYFRMARGKGTCGINRYIMTALLK